jgi:hypothetical protein
MVPHAEAVHEDPETNQATAPVLAVAVKLTVWP